MARRIKKMHPGRGGWSEWQAPVMKGYLMQCCDCELVHEMEFKTFVERGRKKDGAFTAVHLPPDIRVLFRARRERKAQRRS